MKQSQGSRASPYQKEEAENTLLIIQPISLLDRLYIFRDCLSRVLIQKGERASTSAFVGCNSMDFETNGIIASVHDLYKGCRQLIQLFFPIHDKSKVDTEECILYLLSSSICLRDGNICDSILRGKIL